MIYSSAFGTHPTSTLGQQEAYQGVEESTGFQEMTPAHWVHVICAFADLILDS